MAPATKERNLRRRVVEQMADAFDADASVTITNDKHAIEPATTVADMTRRAV